MPVLKIEKFGGMLPAWDDRLLPPDQAAVSQNAYLYAGTLIGWRKPKLLRQLVNSAAAFAYRLPTLSSAVAFAYLIFNANPTAGDTVMLGEEMYTFRTTVVNAYDVLIGANATATATNFFDAITGGGTAGTNYGLGTAPSPAIDQTGLSTLSTHNFGAGALPVVYVQAPAFGAAYNSTVATESTNHARLAWLKDLLAGTDYTTTFVGGTNQSADTSITGSSTWMEFLDPDTTVMRSHVADDSFQRYYFASPSLPPQYNTTARITAGLPPFTLGVPAPGCAPGVDTFQGGDTAELGFVNPAVGFSATNLPGANTLFLVPVTPAGAMQLNDVNIVPTDTSTTANFAAVLYADENGKPGELLNTGVIVTGCTANGTLTSTFVIPTGLLLGVQYWIGFICDSDIHVLLFDNGHVGVKQSSTFSNGPPLVAGTMSTGQPDWNIWGDVTTDSVLETRSYVYTWQTAYGEEGPPSPPTIATAWTNSTWNISLFTPPTTDMGTTRNITTTNLYRAITGSGGETTYFFVTSFPVNTAAFNDTLDDSVVTANSQLQSTLWSPPPEDLQGIFSMPNGMSVGFRSNEIWFAEAYRPHAWPPSYVLTTEFPIVGIGVAGQSVVACTEARPETATGVNPSAMALNKVNIVAPCISRGSVVGSDAGVFYASQNGIILVEPSGNGSNVTESWMTRERWQQLTVQKNIRAVRLMSAYMAFGTVNGLDTSVAQQGYTVELATDSNSFSIWPQPGGHRVGFSTLTAPNGVNINNLLLDPWTGVAMLIQNGGVYYYDFSDPSPAIIPYKWRSKKFQQQTRKNYEAMRIIFDAPPGTPAQNATRDVNATQPNYPDVAGQYGIVRVYADDILVTTREVRVSNELLRILSGFKAETWQFEFEGIVNIKNLKAATSVRELMQIA